MKKINIFLTLLLCVIMMSCIKMSLPAAFNYEVDVADVSRNVATITGNYVGATIDKIVVIYSDDKDMLNAHSEEAVIEGNYFSLTITDLEPETEYYYCLEFNNELQTVRSDEIYNFMTLNKQIISVNDVSFTMIAVEGGTFNMGAQKTDPNAPNYDNEAYDDESPVHSVTLSDYYIGETEVTQELWQAVMGSNPSHFSGYPQPIECVSWNDCKEFITKLNNMTGRNFRLPTEAEWEYAARGGNKSKGYVYSGSNNINYVAWYMDNSSSNTHYVKIKSPNELGIYDMSGNVWEWCEDGYGSYSSGSQTDPTGPSYSSTRVLRGGGCNGSAKNCRVSVRLSNFPDYSYINYGFRLALSQ